MPEAPKPKKISRAGAHDVRIEWSTGEDVVYPARFLRTSCPCASCVDEMTGKRILQESLLPVLIYPTKIEPVGQYAIQLYFSDNHSTGIYTWERLYDLKDKIPARPDKPATH